MDPTPKKKPVALFGALTLIAVAYAAATWFMGTKIENELNTLYDIKLESAGFLKDVMQRDYKRGIFSSEETITFDIRKLAQNRYPLPPEGEDDPLKLALHTTISHGPLPGFSSLGLGTFKTKLVLSQNFDASLRKFFKGQDYLNIQGHYNFDGSGRIQLSIPSFEFSEGVEFKFGGLKIDGDFSPKMKVVDIRMMIPSMEGNNFGGSVKFSELGYSIRYNRVYEDMPQFLLPEKFRISLNDFSAFVGGQRIGALQKFVFDTNASLEGDFINLTSKAGFDLFQRQNQSFGESHLDVSLRHLHAKSLANAWTLLRNIMHEGIIAGFQRKSPGMPPELLLTSMQQELNILMAKIIRNQPEFILDRFSILQSGKGEASAKGFIKLESALTGIDDDFGFTPQMAEALMKLINIQFDLSISPQIIPDSRAPLLFSTLAQQGLAEQNGDKYAINMVFKDGKLMLQGKEIDSSTLKSLITAMP